MLNRDLNDPSPVENKPNQPSPMDMLLNFLSDDDDEEEVVSEAEAEEELRQYGIQPLAVRQTIKDILFGTPQAPVLVIQPFSTLNTEYNSEVLLDMADQISLRLSRYKQVVIRPQSSVFALSHRIQDPVRLARTLGADYVLTGNILGEGEKFSLVTRFSRVRDGAELWEGKYDGSIKRIFEVEDLITERVVRRLNLRLAKDELTRLSKSHSENPDAYHKYRLGRFFLNQYTKASLEKAINLFKEAISLDPGFAPAHAGLADCYIAQGIYNITSPVESFRTGFAHAQDAVRRDATLGESHTSKAYSYMLYGWNWEAAESTFKKAIELAPNHAPAHQGYAHLLGALGRYGEAMCEIDRALELDPTSAFASTVRGFILYYAGSYEESRQQFYRALSINPVFDAAYYGLAIAYEQLALGCLEKGMTAAAREKFDKAEWAARRALKFSRNHSQKKALRAHIYALRKEQDKALAELSQLEELCTKEYVSPFHMATVYAAQGEADKAMMYLKKAYKLRDQWLVLLNVEPRFVSLHHDRRFKKLIRKLNFPNASRLPKRVALTASILFPSVLISCVALLAVSAVGEVSKNSLLMTLALGTSTAAFAVALHGLQKFLRAYNIIILPTIKLSVSRLWRHKQQNC